MKKRVLGIVAVSVFSMGLATLAYASGPIKLIMNGQPLNTDVAPQMVQGRALVPIRTISEALGIDIAWDANEQSVVINNETNKSDNMQVLLLEQALAAREPLAAVKTWAEGVKTRNGAMQYAVMSQDLRKEKYEEFSQNNWSTGVSSPWVAGYEITEKAAEADTYRYEVTFTYTDSTQSTFTENHLVTVKKTDSNWVIAHLSPIDISGTISEVFLEGEEVTAIFVESTQPGKGSYDRGRIEILPETKIYKGYSNQVLTANDLKEGMKVEAAFSGPILMIYPVQGGAKEIMVID